MTDEAHRANTALGLAILAFVLLFGAVELNVWTDRSLWIDEISQLLNYPLESLGQAFGPLPEAQQAAPPLFNLLFHAVAPLPIEALRIGMAALTLGAVLAAFLGAFGPRSLPIAAGLFVLVSHEPFLLNATMLKFYAFEIAGFAIFSAWIYARDRDRAFGWRDFGLLLAGMLLGVSTIVGACVVAGLFLALRLGRRQLGAGEVVLGGLLGLIAIGYYLQIGHATEIQITAFPDAYGGRGLEAELKFAEAAYQLFRARGAVILLVVIAVGILALAVLRGEARARLAGLMLFGLVVTLVFLGLAAIGKYPAVYSRHLIWMLGIFAVLTAAVVHALTLSRQRGLLATGGLVLLGLVLAASAARVALKWPPPKLEGASDRIVEALAELPPSPVVHYLGSFRLIPLMIERGAPIAHHAYAPELSTRSGAIDPSYFGAEWQQMDDETFSARILALLRDDPLGWTKVYVMQRIRGDFRPLARFVLDAAPADGSTFYLSAIHVSWELQEELPTQGLRQVLDERSCEYAPLMAYEALLSPGFVLEVRCPPRP